VRKRPVAAFVDRVNAVLDHTGLLDSSLFEDQVAFGRVLYRFATKGTVNLGKSCQSLIYINVNVHGLVKKSERVVAGKAVSGGTNLQNRHTTRSKSGFVVFCFIHWL